MQPKLVCQDQALLHDLTKNLASSKSSPQPKRAPFSTADDDAPTEEEMIRRYYALKQQVSGSANLGNNSSFLPPESSAVNIEIS